MNKFLFVTYSLCITCFSFGQNEQKLIEIGELFNKGSYYLYSHNDSVHKYLEKSLELSYEIDDLEWKLSNLLYLINAEDYHYDLVSFEKNLNLMASILKNDKRLDTLMNKSVYVKNFLIQKGNYHYKIKNYTTAKLSFQELIDLLEKSELDVLTIEDRTLLFSTYNYLASINEATGKNKSAKDFYKKSLLIGENYEIGNSHARIAGTKGRLAAVFENEEDYTVANSILGEILPLYISLKDNPRIKNNLLSTYQRLSRNYLFQDSIPKAIDVLKESELYYSENDAFERLAILLYGDIYFADKQYDIAYTYYQDYLSKTQTYRGNQKHQDIAEAYTRLGKLDVEIGKPKEALVQYQKALMQLSSTFESEYITENPTPEKVSSKIELIKILREKLKTLQVLYEKNSDVENLKIALTTSYTIIAVLDVLKPEFESKVDKQFLISDMYPAFHTMVAIAYNLYKDTHDVNYIADAFHFMEKSKSILLLQATRSAQASSFGNIPEKIIDQEQRYRAQIIHLEKKLFNQKSNTVVFDSLFKLKNKYYDFITDIEEKYPKYYDLKYNNSVVKLENLQEILGDTKALFSYFSSGDYLFLITSEKEDANFYKIPFGAEIKNSIEVFYSKVSVLDINDLPVIYEVGNYLYKELLEEPLQGITSKELIIIPDDILNYVPFEALSTAETSGGYLIKEYQISYSNSATLLQEQLTNHKEDENRVLAYAPTFEGRHREVNNRTKFGPLLYNTEEAKTITEYFNGKAVLGQEASLHSFTSNSAAYNILHFATHAAANDEFPDYSYLAFATTKEQNLLYVKDLYAYNINADLVTLSACQTGLGKLQKGEGMLSLARGFNYAGARSLVTTLWKINDQTTSKLIGNFYKNLSNASPKDAALRNAKLKYLSSVDDELLTHPYYWSGFIISGNTSSLTSGNTYIYWWLLLLIPLIVAIYKKRKSKKINLKP
ncbi:CHAT domain-containing protein [Aquimarina sp. RZ0]|uniref:CHAT domain-containing protein n=1 Tax=Aquimarina sp. RZ0 TaxID=2607730 RepID=UPI0011F0ABA0|nr:CHAT domain-containing tetratricopeptide repeat protein [Aquimarina sp. RZ0]KAA1247512.1 CHAT domain-containing protein [Aquimarina sp. RZ0]